GLFQNDVSDQRRIATIERFHFQEADLAKDGWKAFDFDSDRATDRPLYNFLSGRYRLDRADLLEVSEPFLPRAWHGQIGRPGVHERIASQAHRRIASIRDGDRRYDSPHFLAALSSR